MKISKIIFTIVVKFGPILFSGRTEALEFYSIEVRNMLRNPIESEAKL
jgi:hypothetical protein